MNEPVHHMNEEEFRRRADETVAFITNYWTTLASGRAPWPVLSAAKPGDVIKLLPQNAPERPEPWEAIAADVDRLIMPALTHWQHPSFFAFFPSNISAPAVLGELLSAGLGVQGMLWATSPAATELETRVLDWMARLIGLPDSFLATSPNGGGVIQGTASEATLVAMVAARDRARRAMARPANQPTPQWIVYTSNQAHSSILKAAMISGIADNTKAHDGLIGGGVRLIAVDDQCRMRTDLLNQAITADLAAGLTPLFVCASVGTTGSAAVDDLREIGAICERHGLWLHVDAAYAGAACICEEHRWMLSGVEHADSFAFNPHKWLLTNFDCNLFWTRDRRALTASLSVTPEYLRNAATDTGQVWDYRDWQVPLGRRFRSLKLWFVLRWYGAAGLRAYIREHIRLSELFESLVRADKRFEVVVPRGLGLICFALRGVAANDQKTLLDRINADGRIYLTHTVLPPLASPPVPEGRFVFRMAIGAVLTREEHVRQAWAEIQRAAGTLPR